MLDRNDPTLTGVRNSMKTDTSDTLSGPSQLPDVTSASDTLQIHTAGAPNGEVVETPHEKPGEGSADTVQIIVPVAGPRAAPDAIWDRIDSRDSVIQAKQTEPPPAPRQQTPVAPKPDVTAAGEQAFRYDASYYLDTGPDTPFFREHILPLRDPVHVKHAPNAAVFLETGVLNYSSSAPENYKAYLEADVSGHYENNIHYSFSWIPGLVILSLLLLAWIKLAYVQFITPVLFSTFNYKEALKLYNSKNNPANNASLILHLIFAVNSGLFLLFIAWHFNFNLPPVSAPLLFISASLLLVLLFALKSVALGITGFLFDATKFFAEYTHNISLYNKITGILLMPLIVGLLYADPVVHGILIRAGLGLGGLIYLLQLIRGLEILTRKHFSVFYLILYLCAFEILPLCILYKLFDTFLI